MAWHKCARFWKYGASCPVRGMPGHEVEEEEEDDEEADDERKHGIPIEIKAKRPAEPGSVVALAEAVVREIETREVAQPVGGPGREVAQPVGGPVPAVPVPEWVPAVSDIVVPQLYPTPADVVASASVVPDPRVASLPTSLAEVGDRVVQGVIAAGVGALIGVVGPTIGMRLVTISRILAGLTPQLAPQAGTIGLPTARSLLIAAGATVVRAAAAKIPDQPPPPEVVEQAEALTEELVVDYVYPTAAERTVSISKILLGLSGDPRVGDAYVHAEPFDYSASVNPFGDWNDAFMAPGMYGPPPAESSPTLASGAGAGGYLYDFGQYLNSQLGSLEIPGGSPPPTTY